MKMSNKTIKIADDFSKCVGGRFRTLGKFSAEEFRDDHLIPFTKKSQYS